MTPETSGVRRLTSLCIFCGSQSGTRPAYREAALSLGRALAGHGTGSIRDQFQRATKDQTGMAPLHEGDPGPVGREGGAVARGEARVAEYVKGVLEAEGIPTQTFALDPSRANLVARLKGIPNADITKRVDEVCERTAIGDVKSKIIGKLSKGYRQRVGLAQAIVHEPPVLILDEPTSGLDPTQIIETRKLIAELGQDRTVLVSTHILSEVEKTCTRAVIIARGKVLAQGPLADLCPPGQSLEKMFLDLVEEREAVGA